MRAVIIGKILDAKGDNAGAYDIYAEIWPDSCGVGTALGGTSTESSGGGDYSVTVGVPAAETAVEACVEVRAHKLPDPTVVASTRVDVTFSLSQQDTLHGIDLVIQ